MRLPKPHKRHNMKHDVKPVIGLQIAHIRNTTLDWPKLCPFQFPTCHLLCLAPLQEKGKTYALPYAVLFTTNVVSSASNTQYADRSWHSTNHCHDTA